MRRKLPTLKPYVAEWVTACLSLIACLFALRPLLLDGSAILPHDNFYWCYPIFHFFAEGLTQGRLPLWNPFMHGGEPFYPLLGQIRLWDPIALFTPLVARYFSNDTVVWFNWTRFLQALVMVGGTYLVLRPLARLSWVRLSLLPLLLFSSFLLGTFPQDGILAAFAWVPYLCWFGLRLIHRKGSPWTNWIGAGLSFGLAWQSYHFAGTWVFLLIVLSGIALFHRRWGRRVFRGDSWKRPALVSAILVGMMALPNFALFTESSRFVFPLRMAPANYQELPPYGGPIRTEGDASYVSFGWWMPASFVRFTGGSAQPWDFLQMVAPDGNPATHGDPKGGWGSPSESYLYFGLLPWVLSLFGLCVARGRKKKLALWTTVAFGLLMLGFKGGLFKLLRPVFPPLWGLRNTGLLVLFFELGFLYFYLIGVERAFGRKQKASPLAIVFFLALSYVQLGIALHFASRPEAMALRWLWSLFIPAAAALAASHFGWKRTAGALCLLALAFDLGSHITEARLLRAGMPHPALQLGVSTSPRRAVFPETREIAPDQKRQPGQAPLRYYPLLEHHAYAFSPAVKQSIGPDPLTEVWHGVRWNSFFLSRSYFDWTQAARSADEIRDSFAIGKPLLQLLGEKGPQDMAPTVLAYDYDSLTVKIAATEAGKLTWSDGFDSRWKATLDGVSIPVERWQGNFKAVSVPPGSHEIRFVFRPWFFLIAFVAFQCALAIGLTLIALTELGKRSPRPGGLFNRFLPVRFVLPIVISLLARTPFFKRAQKVLMTLSEPIPLTTDLAFRKGEV